LTEKGVPFQSVNYLEKPLSADELKKLLQQGGLRPQQVLRTNEPAYKQLVAGKDLSDEQLMELIAARPELLQRPIVVRDGRAVLARPAKNLAILGIE
jgi:arsenate reductase (glutaredoxin)